MAYLRYIKSIPGTDRPAPELKAIRSLHLGINTSEGLQIISIRNILYCQSSGNYCHLFFENGKSLLISKTLKHVQSVLPPDLFHRVHQSYLIRIDAITLIDQRITLVNGEEIPISRSKRVAFLDFMTRRLNVI